MSEIIMVTPRGTDATNSTNGFVLDHSYLARRAGMGLMVTLQNGHDRFVTADGNGGAHLQHREDRGAYDSLAITAGKFEIKTYRPEELILERDTWQEFAKVVTGERDTARGQRDKMAHERNTEAKRANEADERIGTLITERGRLSAALTVSERERDDARASAAQFEAGERGAIIERDTTRTLRDEALREAAEERTKLAVVRDAIANALDGSL